ncbi:MAG TPA: hypothetical protein H9870_04455 [Candidatus Corynebacterium avicola]|uniref:Uncharacterized protein n=1 Tax=Candidatus Corynebacterium avicola TaxID=2838527 RepID=A0A9D1RQL0_9CORY|nr:hypothetical protein [Candidatus Corynebacterium avicola]
MTIQEQAPSINLRALVGGPDENANRGSIDDSARDATFLGASHARHRMAVHRFLLVTGGFLGAAAVSSYVDQVRTVTFLGLDSTSEWFGWLPLGLVFATAGAALLIIGVAALENYRWTSAYSGRTGVAPALTAPPFMLVGAAAGFWISCLMFWSAPTAVGRHVRLGADAGAWDFSTWMSYLSMLWLPTLVTVLTLGAFAVARSMEDRSARG